MKWLLVILLFQLDANGQPGPPTPAQKVFTDQDSCLTAGATARAAIPKEVLSVATCIPQNAFDMDTAPAARTAPAPSTPTKPKPEGK